MALWMMRAGRHGEYEDHFLTASRICLTWGEPVRTDLSRWKSRSDIVQTLREHWPDASAGTVGIHAGQIWTFLHTMKVGDLVVVPSKKKPELHFGLIGSDVKFETTAEPDYRHFRDVTWLQDIPRSAMDRDLLYSFGAVMTICEISRNDAEARVRRMLKLTASKASEASPADTTNMKSPAVDVEAATSIARSAISAL